jgi:hypothetical protein
MSRLSSLSNSAAAIAVVITLLLVPHKILIHEHEEDGKDEKNHILSHAYALRSLFHPVPSTAMFCPVPFLIFRIPTPEFLTPYTIFMFLRDRFAIPPLITIL